MHKIIKNLISCFLSIAVIFSFFYFAADMNVYADTSGATVTISGTFYLSNGEKAGAGGVRVSISAKSVNQFLATNITIPEGSNSQSYSISVPKDAISSVWLLHYSISGLSNHYLTTGYYGGTKSVINDDKAVLVDIDTDTNLSNINLYTIPTNCVSGKVNMPFGETASDNIGVRVSAVSSEYTRTSNITIPKGQNSASYNLAIPVDYASSNWKIKYDVIGNSTDKAYVTTGYYSTNGTKTKSEDAFTFAGISENKTDIDMDLVPNGTNNTETSNVVILSIDNSDQAVSNLSNNNIYIYEKHDYGYGNVYYTNIAYSTDISIAKLQDKYVIKIKDLNWSNDDTYYTWIQFGNKLLKIDLDKSMGLQTVTVPQDVIPVKIDVPFGQTNFKINSISVYPINEDHTLEGIFLYNPGSTIYIPAGTYGFQINASDDTNNYILTQPSCALDSTNNIVSFEQKDLSKLDINVNDSNNYKWQLCSIIPMYFNSVTWINMPINKPLFVSSLPYNGVLVELYSRKGWQYEFNISDVDLSKTLEKSLTVDNNFNAKLTFSNSSYSGGSFSNCNFNIEDGNNNRLNYIWDEILYNQPKLNMKFYNDNITYEPDSSNLIFPYDINPKLPFTPGQYNVSAELNGSENHKLDKTISAQGQILITKGADGNIPTNTVIIGSNAYNVRCLFKPDFSSEISKLAKANPNNIYFKIAGTNQTNWTKLADPFETIDGSSLPAVTYNDGNGNIVKYAQGDGGITP